MPEGSRTAQPNKETPSILGRRRAGPPSWPITSTERVDQSPDNTTERSRAQLERILEMIGLIDSWRRSGNLNTTTFWYRSFLPQSTFSECPKVLGRHSQTRKHRLFLGGGELVHRVGQLLQQSGTTSLRTTRLSPMVHGFLPDNFQMFSRGAARFRPRSLNWHDEYQHRNGQEHSWEES
uniref:(northern house mosquito) hypothetical protein n=1 Tax=Culex pipiens TaxID=7175 RepID=A0A8D8F8Y2_CULPI